MEEKHYSSDSGSLWSDGAEEGDEGQDLAEKMHKKKYTPHKFSGNNYTFDFHSESGIIDNLRAWEEVYFAEQSWIFKKMSISMSTMRDHIENSDFDLLVRILRISEKDELNLELKIKDLSNDTWYLTIPKLKFGSLKQGEIIKIRTVKINITSKKNIIELQPSSNLMRFTFKN